MARVFFHKGVFVCMLMAFMAYTCPVWAAPPAQAVEHQKLAKVKGLTARLNSQSLTEDQKLQIMAEILQLSGELAEEAKANNDVDLSAEVVLYVGKVTDALAAIVSASSENVTALAAAASLIGSANQVMQTAAETARATGNADLAQRTMNVTADLNAVNTQVGDAAQKVVATSGDRNAINAATALIANVTATESSIQNTMTAAAAGGATSPPVSPQTDADTEVDTDEPGNDNLPASPN